MHISVVMVLSIGVSVLLAYLVMFFISTERTKDGEVYLRKESVFWKMKYAAYFLPASLTAFFNGSTLRGLGFNTALLQNSCEDYANRDSSLCKTFWSTCALFVVVSPLMVCVYVVVGALWAVSLAVYYLLYACFYIVAIPIAIAFYPFYVTWKWYKRKKLASIKAKESVPTFSNSSLKKLPLIDNVVDIPTYIDLYFATEKRKVGEIYKLHVLANNYLLSAARKLGKKNKKELLRDSALELMYDLSYAIYGYHFDIETDYGEFELVAEYRLLNDPLLKRFFIEVSEYYGSEFEEVIESMDSLYQDLVKEVTDYVSESGACRSDYFDVDIEGVDTEAAEEALNDLCTQATEHFEKELEKRMVSVFTVYKDTILKFLTTALYDAGIVMRDRAALDKLELEANQSKILRIQQMEKEETKAEERQRRRERMRHFFELAKMFFGKVCPIIRVK